MIKTGPHYDLALITLVRKTPNPEVRAVVRLIATSQGWCADRDTCECVCPLAVAGVCAETGMDDERASALPAPSET